MVQKRGYTDVIHVSRVNKLLFKIYCKKELIEASPELEGMNISEDRVMISLIRYYLGGKYYDLKSKVENELDRT